MSAQVHLPIQTIGSFTFNIGALMGIEWDYTDPESNESGVLLILAGAYEHFFGGEEAEVFRTWYAEITGQNRIQPASFRGVVG